MDRQTDEFGPYRATKLWNEIVCTFRNGMPLRRHRRHMHVYDNCFSATSAVDWLHFYLQNNAAIGTNVSRDQTIQLLQKFLKCRVFENVKKNTDPSPPILKDNGTLYRFTDGSPFKLFGTPRRKPLNDCQNTEGSVSKKQTKEQSLNRRQLVRLSNLEIEEIWKKLTLARLQTALGLPDLNMILDVISINSKFIIHNATRINKNGIVIVVDKEDDLPHWVVSAMKCLIHWPYASASEMILPKYSGVENDVYRVVKSYFKNQAAPLCTFAMYDVFINCLVRTEYLDSSSVLRSPSTSVSFQPATATSLMSTEQLTDDLHSYVTSTPSSHPFLSSCSCKMCRLISVDIEPIDCEMSESKVEISNFATELCYETAFTESSPVTRIVSKSQLANGSWHLRNLSFRKFNSNNLPLSDISPVCKAFSEMSASKTDSIIPTNGKSVRRLRNRSGGYCNLAYLGSNDGDKLKTKDLHSESSSDSYHTATVPVTSYPTLAKKQPAPSVATDECLSHSSYFTAEACTESDATSWNNWTTGESDDTLNCTDYSKYSSTSSKQYAIQEWVDKACWPDAFSDSGRQRAIDVLQIVSLILPPSNRRKLHFLLQFMSKVASNQNLSLSEDMRTKPMVLQTFLRCIVYPNEGNNYDEVQALRLVTFLMDHYKEIFTPPEGLKDEVERAIARTTSEKISRTHPKPSSTVTYCEQVTNEEYQKQGVQNSQNALCKLLKTIVEDHTLPHRDKQKQLKKFKKAYPEIYAQHFPTLDSDNNQLYSHHQGKQTFKKSLFQRLKLRV